ncbi:MAG: phosphoglycolate phosphatase [Halobacteriales archaeon]|nr:phosphoglycolate phosphatase [Halobacteriales archaeon]
MTRPLVLDIDGTLSGPDRAIEGRVFDRLRAWPEPIVIATGKAFPYPIALCQFIGLPPRAVAENGGVAFAEDTVVFNGDPEAVARVEDDLTAAGHDLGWGAGDLVNRWRETELAISREVPREPIDRSADRHGLEVIDSGFAYHVKPPDVDKGAGLVTVAELLDIDPETFVAVGDSENDVATFTTAGVSFAVANADDRAQAAADYITDGSYAAGLFEALDAVEARSY